MNRVRSLFGFTDSFQDKSSKEKKVVVTVIRDPRYINTVNCATDYFNEHDLDPYFIAKNAPGRHAFNRVERRMSNLAKN